MEPDDLISTAEVADILGIDRSGVIKRIGRDLKPVKKLDGRTGVYLFDRATIEALRSAS